MTIACAGIGVASSASVAQGLAYLLSRGPICVTPSWVDPGHIDEEIGRFEKAVQIAGAQLRGVRQEIPGDAPSDIAEFIDTHLLMLEDKALSSQPIRLIREQGLGAEWALQQHRDALVEVKETRTGSISFGAAIVVYNSFLPQLGGPDERDAISSRGWALGYLVTGSVMVGFGMLGRAELAFVVMNIAYVQNRILDTEAFYMLMITIFWLNVAVPITRAPRRARVSAMAAPIAGNTMKAQTWPSAQSPWNTAVASDRAGFTDVFDTGIEIMWTSAKPSPAAIGPKPFGTPSSSSSYMMPL